MKRKRLPLVLTVLSMGMLILDSRHTVQYGAAGIDLCIRAVIPSLFPFFVLSIYLTGNLTPKNAAASLLLSGFLGGYPVGAQATAENWRTGRLSREQANRMLMFCSQTGPSFLFGMVGGQFPAAKYAWFLWAVQLLSALSVAALVPGAEKQPPCVSQKSGITLPEALKKATAVCASVCGWAVLFRVVLGYAEYLPLSNPWNVLVAGLLELTNGCLRLASVENLGSRFLLAAVMLNFGGLCVILQTASVIHTLNLRYYLLGKLLQTAFCILYSLCFLGHLAALIPVFCVFLLFRRGIPIKRSSIPTAIGV